MIQSDLDPEAFWATPAGRGPRRRSASGEIKVFVLDAFAIAREEASDAELRYRMQGAAFLGAFFSTAPLLEREGGDRGPALRGDSRDS